MIPCSIVVVRLTEKFDSIVNLCEFLISHFVVQEGLLKSRLDKSQRPFDNDAFAGEEKKMDGELVICIV